MTEPRTLKDLEREEERLLELLASVEGTMEAKTAALEALGVFGTYTKIHQEYVERAQGGDVEALKRAIFLQWFEVVEPSFLTGIRNLDQGAAAVAMVLVEQLCATAAIDDELAWMLPYYYLIAEWAFPRVEECPHIVAYCKTNESQGLVQYPNGTQLMGRGQMGDYWRSMQRTRTGG